MYSSSERTLSYFPRMRYHRIVAHAALTSLLLVAATAQLEAQRPALDSARLMADLSALAADSMEGRRIGTPGGARARAYLLRAFARIGLAPVPDSFPAPFATRTRNGTAINGVNLVGAVRGTTHADRYIVVSAHYDHLGVRGTEIFNGADDNASGTAGVLALAQWFAVYPPENSLLFVLFDGEESGELGSKAFVDNSPVPLEQIAADVNLDMVSRNARGELYVAGSAPNPVLKPLLDSTAAVSRVKLLFGHDTGAGQDNWIHQSDQGSFADKKIPFAYFGVEDHPDYHRSTDDVERIDPGFFYRSVETVADFVVRLDRNLDRVAAVRAGLPVRRSLRSR
jgi:Zn-dependent M28 family amino/carboxypeptidase